MDKQTFLDLMRFPLEWDEWGMYPDDLSEFEISGYKPGHENGAEHDRNGAFHWWIKRNPSKDELKKLVKLSRLDPDKGLGAHMRKHILKAANCDEEVRSEIESIEQAKTEK